MKHYNLTIIYFPQFQTIIKNKINISQQTNDSFIPNNNKPKHYIPTLHTPMHQDANNSLIIITPSLSLCLRCLLNKFSSSKKCSTSNNIVILIIRIPNINNYYYYFLKCYVQRIRFDHKHTHTHTNTHTYITTQNTQET